MKPRLRISTHKLRLTLPNNWHLLNITIMPAMITPVTITLTTVARVKLLTLETPRRMMKMMTRRLTLKAWKTRTLSLL